MSAVYFAQAGEGGPVKIGFTQSDVARRLAGLQTGCPHPMKLLASVPGGPSDERGLHAKLRRHRVSGEWFNPHIEVLALVERATSPDFCWQAELPAPSISPAGPFASRIIEDLMATADAYCAAKSLSRSRVSTLVFNDGKKLDLVAGGADLQTGKFEHAMSWFATNWPDNVAWPLGIARPSVTVAADKQAS